MKSERREWHCALFFAGLILTIPALFSLLPASASSGWGISHIHAALLGGTTALLTAALASAYGREICLQKRFAWLAYGLLSGGMVILALEPIGIGVDPWVSIAAGFVLGARKGLGLFALGPPVLLVVLSKHARSLLRRMSFCGRFGVVGNGSACRMGYCCCRCCSLYFGNRLCV